MGDAPPVPRCPAGDAFAAAPILWVEGKAALPGLENQPDRAGNSPRQRTRLSPRRGPKDYVTCHALQLPALIVAHIHS